MCIFISIHDTYNYFYRAIERMIYNYAGFHVFIKTVHKGKGGTTDHITIIKLVNLISVGYGKCTRILIMNCTLKKTFFLKNGLHCALSARIIR